MEPAPSHCLSLGPPRQMRHPGRGCFPGRGLCVRVAEARANVHTHKNSFRYLTFSRNERNVEFYFPFSLLFFSLSSSCIRLFLYPFQLMTLQFEIKFGLTVDSLNLFLTSFLCIF